MAATLLLGSRLGDALGRRRVLLVGMGGFVGASALCALAPDSSALIAGRAVQGALAAIMVPQGFGLIRELFGDEGQQKAFGVFGPVMGLAAVAGPLLGGGLVNLDVLGTGWRAIFLVNVPVAIVAAVLLGRHVAETRRHRHPLDAPGQTLAVIALTLLTAGFIVAGAVAFVVTERMVSHPMVDPVLFVRRTFSLSVAIGVIFNFCLYGAVFCLALDLHDAHRLGAFTTGLAMLPMTLVVGTTAYLSGRAVTRFGEWRVMAAGLGAGALGAVLVAVNAVHGPVWLLVLSTAPLGLTAMAMPAMSATAMAGAPAYRVGLASGVLNAARQTGAAFGVAVLGALLRVSGGVQLHAAFAAIAGAYIIGVGLASTGRRLSTATH
jgi:MFS transporter, DHA2 family, methylenomycin A resistance protein